ncbi:MAG: hypothetical protein WCQ21_09160 [Verrucomicrobiota bacterium]|jgi:hypothetical protein
MKPRLAFLLLALSCAAGTQRPIGGAVEYHFDNSYALVAVTELRAFLELRSYERDAVLDNVVLSSRYMPPEFEAKDLVLGEDPEFIVRTRGGGTGIAETHLAVYGIVGQHIRRFGDFVVDRQAQSWPDSDYQEKLSGKVSFPKKGELIHRYTQAVRKKGKTVTKSATERFTFDSKQMQYERAKQP